MFNESIKSIKTPEAGKRPYLSCLSGRPSLRAYTDEKSKGQTGTTLKTPGLGAEYETPSL